MRYSFFIFLLFICYACQNLNTANKEKWIALYNGKDFSDWTIKFANQDLNVNYLNTFRAQDSMIRIVYDDYDTFDDAYAHMYYKTPFSYYKLRFDYRFTGEQVKGGENWNTRNSGIMLHSQSAESNDYGQYFPVSIEIQLLGGLNAGERTTGNVCTPGTALVIDGKVDYRHCINSNSKTYHGDKWVRAEVVVLGGESIAHLIENDTVLKYQLPQIGGGFTNSKLGEKDWISSGVVESVDTWTAQAGKILTKGYISLQAESHPIDFKNIKLLNLCGCKDPKAENYKSYYLKSDNQKCIY
ncbi:MAG: hypothetical protein CMC22_02075 [Flavobacteriaceae bacterium]|nr:hypothetical protein [Flavobacteriaceae bacterium]|tara:strand:- start:198 stop:1091 length:894 start_codon:yes stop_codon:yes gene_type:complete